MMKFKGKAVTKADPVIVVIPKGDDHIVFTCKPVEDYKPFDALCPEPVEQVFKRPNGEIVEGADPNYEKANGDWFLRKFNYMFYQSIQGDGIEFETVDANKPDTWENAEQELRDNGFSSLEVSKLITACQTANGLNNDAIQAATDSFLASRREGSKLSPSSQTTDQPATASGESAKDGE